MKKFLLMMLVAAMPAAVFTACSDNDDPIETTKKVELSASPSTTVSVGDVVTFSVKADGKEVASGYKLYKDNVEFTGNTFTTTEEGTFEFKALYDNVESAKVTITVIDEKTTLAEAAAGTYDCDIYVSIDGVEGEEPIESDIAITAVADDKITLQLEGFEFGPNMGIDVEARNIPVTGTIGNIVVNYSDGVLQPFDILGEKIEDAEYSIEGTIKGNDINVTLDIDLTEDLGMEIGVRIVGKKKQ